MSYNPTSCPNRLGPCLAPNGATYRQQSLVGTVATLEMDRPKQSLPAHYAPSTVNHHLALVRAVLRYALKRNLLQSVPYVPTEKVIRKQPRWYSEVDRDRLLAGLFETQP